MNEDVFPIGKKVSIHAYVGQIEMCQKPPELGTPKCSNKKKTKQFATGKKKVGEMDKLIPAPRTKGCQ